MLIISRKVDESFVLHLPDGSSIEVMVTDIRRAGTSRPYCRIGIAAPDAVVIRRSELGEIEVATRRQGAAVAENVEEEGDEC